MIAILGHDLRSPLSAIHVSAQAMQRRSRLDAADSRALLRILAGIERMEGLIDHVLNFARARAHGAESLVVERFAFAELAESVVEERGQTHPECTIGLESEGETSGEWDRHWVAAAISNLVGNAIVHGDRNHAIEARVRGLADAVTLEVVNHGSPIPAALLPHLFDPFRRGRAEEGNERHRGLGLGLYIVKQAVDYHGGRIAVRSTIDEGTRFTVHLPRRPASRRA